MTRRIGRINGATVSFVSERALIGRMVSRGLMLAAALASMAAGCNASECHGGQVRCRNNVAEYCGLFSEDRGSWVSEDCGAGYCKLSSDPQRLNPFCALAPDPDSRCGQASSLRFCDGNSAIACRQGYLTDVANCTAGESFGVYAKNSGVTRYCVSESDWANCVLEPSPNPLCLAAGSSEVTCDGDKLLTCTHGYLMLLDQCPTGGTCASTQLPFCAIGQQPDPACVPNQLYSTFCRDGMVYQCDSGWVRTATACNGNEVCTGQNGDAYCALK